MTLLDQLERRFGRYAIPGLMRIIVVFNALVFVLGKANPALPGVLDLTADGLARHEYWRLITFLFIPRTESYLFILLALMFFWQIGETLEQEWGAFRLNLFYFLGMLGTTVAALFFGVSYSNEMLNLSLIFAYAYFRPDVLLLFPPVPMKWLAWFLAAYTAYSFFAGPWAARGAILASLINYLLFFGPEFLAQAHQRQRVAGRRRRFVENSLSEDTPIHRCTVCGQTEQSAPDLEFRVSSRDGEEYCLEHLPRAR